MANIIIVKSSLQGEVGEVYPTSCFHLTNQTAVPLQSLTLTLLLPFEL